MTTRIELLICDLDNTLYDWVSFFANSFYAMIETAIPLLGVSEDRLLDDLQAVHQRYHNSEQPFALIETRAAIEKFPNATRREIRLALDSAFHAFNSARKRHLRTYPDIEESLASIQQQGALIVAHTEATVVNAEFRLHKLGLTKFFYKLYAVEHLGSPHPSPERLEEVTHVTELRTLLLHERKPDIRILQEICQDVRVNPSRTLYVGDSISRDVGMANAAGVHSAWAKYGTVFSAEDWKRLVRITHWTAEDVERSRHASELYGASVPEVTLEYSFAELLCHFAFAAPSIKIA